MSRTIASITAMICVAGLAACGQPREPVEAKPPELTINGGVSLGGSLKISAPEREGPNPVWTQRLVGASAPAVAASKVDAAGGHLQRLIELEALVAEGVRSGQFSETDLAQVRARRYRAEANLAGFVRDLGQAKARYNAVIGPAGTVTDER